MNIHKVLKTFGCIALIVFGTAYVDAQDEFEKPNKPLQDFSMKRSASATDRLKELESSFSLSGLLDDSLESMAIFQPKESGALDSKKFTNGANFSLASADKDLGRWKATVSKVSQKGSLRSGLSYSTKRIQAVSERGSGVDPRQTYVPEDLEKWIIEN